MIEATGARPRQAALRAAGAPARARLDPVDRALVEQLRRDGRVSHRALAKALGLNEATVRRRLRRMEDAAVLRVVALTDLEALGYPLLAILHIRVGDRAVTELGADFARLPEAIAVSIASGPFGLIGAIVARDGPHLADILGKSIPRIAGIGDVRCELALDFLRYESTWAMLAGPPPVEPPNAAGALDELDLAIVRALRESARTSYRRVAAELGIADGTVRARVGRMEREGLIRLQPVLDVQAFGMTASAYVGIRVHDGRIEQVAEGLLACEGVSILMRTLGDFHFVAVLQAVDRQELMETILARMAGLPGVDRVETSEIWRLVKHSYTLARIS